MTQEEQKTIKLCILRLEALCDVKNTGCGVEPEHKEAVSLYVETWVTPLLVEVAKAPKDRNGYWSLNVDGEIRSHEKFKLRSETT